jgi:hypothetical protein
MAIQLTQPTDASNLLPGSCLSFITEQEYLDFASAATFNSGLGQVVLAGDDCCLSEVADLAKTAFMALQVAGAISPTVYEKLGTSEEQVNDIYNKVFGYTDGYMLMTSWSWPDSEVSEGDTVGLCITQFSTENASCWGLTK